MVIRLRREQRVFSCVLCLRFSYITPKFSYITRVQKVYLITVERSISFPVAQMVEHGASNAKIMGSILRESKS